MSGMTLGIKKNEDDEPVSAILIDISDGPKGETVGFVDIKLATK